MVPKRLHLAAISALCLSASAQADLIVGFGLENTPDIASFFIDYDYDSGSDALSVSGFAFQLDAPGVHTIDNGAFAISATVDGAGAASGGSLSITGDIPTLPAGPGTLLTGDLTNFGFDPGGGLMQFAFSVTGGELAGMFGGIGSSVGVILSQLGGFGGDFSSDFSGSLAVSDTAPLVPAPGALAALAFGALAFRRRRRGL